MTYRLETLPANAHITDPAGYLLVVQAFQQRDGIFARCTEHVAHSGNVNTALLVYTLQYAGNHLLIGGADIVDVVVQFLLAHPVQQRGHNIGFDV